MSLRASLSALLLSSLAFGCGPADPAAEPTSAEALVDPPAAIATDDPADTAAPGARPAPAGSACEATSPRARPVEVVVTPTDGDARTLALIAAAKTSLDVTIYQLSSRSVVNALVAAATRGVRVRIVQDRRQTSDATLATLRAGGVDVKTSSPRFHDTHQKTVLVDAKTAFVFSGNLDRLSFGSGRNFGIVDDDPADVAGLEEVFEADWSDRTPSLPCTRLVVAPINARARIVALLGSATKTLDVEAMYVTDNDVASAIVAARARGVVVRVLLNDPSFDMGDSSLAVSRFAQAGIPVKRSGSLFIHAKLLVVDGRHAFVGSENFSSNSLDHNREAGIVVSKPSADIDRISATFAADWAASPVF